MSDIPLFDEPTPAADLQNTLNILINEINLLIGTSAVNNASALYSSRLIAALTPIPISIVAFQTAGYYTRGDGGGALYITTSGSTPGGFQSVGGRWWELAEQPLNIRMFGAKGDGATDDTVAIQTAISGIPAHGTMSIPLGDYLVSGGGTEIFLRTSSINILGEGSGSRILVAPTVGNTTDIFRIAPTTSVFGDRYENFTVEPLSGTPGRYPIYFDFTGHNSVLYFGVVVDHLRLVLSNGFPSFKSKSDSGSAGGGLAYATISECFIDGINLEHTGDNIGILNNTIISDPSLVSALPGVEASFATGAANLQIIGNVMGRTGGMIILHSGTSVVIAFNEFETNSGVASTSTYGALIVLLSDVDAIINTCIVYNGFSVLPGNTDIPVIVGPGLTLVTEITGNRFYTYEGQVCIQLDALAIRSLVGVNSYTVANATEAVSVTDNSVSSRYTPAGGYHAGTVETASALGMTSTVTRDLGSVALAGGTWDISAIVNFKPAAGTTIDELTAGFSLTTATVDDTAGYSAYQRMASLIPGSNEYISVVVPPCRVIIPIGGGGLTVVYLVALAVFGVSTLAAWGQISARQVA